MGHVLQLPKHKKLQPPTSTAIPNYVHIAGEPTLETTFVECLAIRKWLHFALHDVHYQLNELSKDKTVSKRSFAEARQTAMTMSAYLMGVVQDLEQRMAREAVNAPPS